MAAPDNQTDGRLQAVLEAALDCIVCMDVHGRIREFNPAAERTFGHSRAAVLGKELAEILIPPELREQHRKGMAHYLRTGEARVLGKRIEIPALRADGSTILVELAITAIHSLEGPFFTAYLRDITAARRHEQRRAVQYAVADALSGARKIQDVGPRILQTLAELAGWAYGAIWVRGKNKGGLHTAATWRSNLPGLSEFEKVSEATSFKPGQGLPGRVLESGTAQWICDVTQDPHFLRAQAAADAGLHAGYAFPLLTSSEIVGVIEFFGFSVQGPDDDLLKISAVLGSYIGEFMERQIAEEGLEEQKRAAEAANAAKDRFIAMLSHELRTPLTPVLMWASAAVEDDSIPPDVREDVDMVRRNIALEARLIDDLLQVSRIQHGKVRVRKRVCALPAVLRDAVELARPEIDAKQHLIELRIGGVIPDIACDPDRLQQVFSNLIQNACKFTPPRGRIILENYIEGSFVRIDVTDSGVGIPPESLRRLFEPFEQGSNKSVGGLGLGLAIARGLVELHDGTLEARSGGLGQGATFTVRLPITATA